MLVAQVSATATDDFVVPGTTLATFTTGVDFVDMSFTIKEDTVVEDLECFTITLQTPTRGAIGEPRVATVFIVDETSKFSF